MANHPHHHRVETPLVMIPGAVGHNYSGDTIRLPMLREAKFARIPARQFCQVNIAHPEAGMGWVWRKNCPRLLRRQRGASQVFRINHGGVLAARITLIVRSGSAGQGS